MKHQKLCNFDDQFRPGAPALVGDFFIKAESPRGSIFLLVGNI
jgi:hypothetical protein